MSGTRWAVLCADGRDKHGVDLGGLNERGARSMARDLDLDFPLIKCGPHRVVERLTVPEPWILDLIRAVEQENDRGDTQQEEHDALRAISAALAAVPEVWREAARGEQT